MINNAQHIDDAHILAEAIRLVGEGVEVIFPVNGRSMRPFIEGGSDSVLLTRPTDIKPFDVVLAKAEQGHYVIHRVLSIKDNRVTLMGDGNLLGRESCDKGEVYAKVTHIVSRKGKKRSLSSPHMRFAQKMWFYLLPLRKYLLKFYRLYILIKKI